MARLSVVFALILFFCNQVHARTLQVVTYNTALAQVNGIALVSCRNERLAKQIEEFPLALHPPFVLLLQEVQGNDAEKKYREMAKAHGWFVSRISWHRRGIMTISSEPIIEDEEQFVPYTKDQWQFFNWNGKPLLNFMKRGVLKNNIRFGGKKLHLFNTHTAFGNGEAVSYTHLTQLQELAKSAVGYNESVILGGDLNMGGDLEFWNQNYNPQKRLWNPFLSAIPFEFILPGHKEWEFTSDHLHNPLLSSKGELRKRIKYHANLDHIFVSDDLKVSQMSELFFRDHVKITKCPKDSYGLSPLSDHYGRTVEIRF